MCRQLQDFSDGNWNSNQGTEYRMVTCKAAAILQAGSPQDMILGPLQEKTAKIQIYLLSYIVICERIKNNHVMICIRNLCGNNKGDKEWT